jgi:hypothetical protein
MPFDPHQPEDPAPSAAAAAPARIDDQSIVTIARYDQAAYAHMARARLEAAGIPAMVAGDNQPGLLLFHAVIGRSVEVQVFERDADAALEILQSEAAPADAASVVGELEPDAAAPEDPAAPVCPQCGSTRLTLQPRRGPWLTGLLLATLPVCMILVGLIAVPALVLLLLLTLPGWGRRWRCDACGADGLRAGSPPGLPGTRAQLGRRAGYW